MNHFSGCCVDFYQLPITQFLLGDSFHPGGIKLTKQLAQPLLLGRDSRVLDIASGQGTSSLFLAEQYGCQLVALDLSHKNLAITQSIATKNHISSNLSTVLATADNLPFASNSFDAIICECALCTFSDPQHAISEMFRVLKPGGRLGISDMVLNQPLPKRLKNILAEVLCISGAQSAMQYINQLQSSGFSKIRQTAVNWAITEMLAKVKKQVELLDGISDKQALSVPDWLIDSDSIVEAINDFVEKDGLGYILINARKERAAID